MSEKVIFRTEMGYWCPSCEEHYLAFYTNYEDVVKTMSLEIKTLPKYCIRCNTPLVEVAEEK